LDAVEGHVVSQCYLRHRTNGLLQRVRPRHSTRQRLARGFVRPWRLRRLWREFYTDCRDITAPALPILPSNTGKNRQLRDSGDKAMRPRSGRRCCENRFPHTWGTALYLRRCAARNDQAV